MSPFGEDVRTGVVRMRRVGGSREIGKPPINQESKRVEARIWLMWQGPSGNRTSRLMTCSGGALSGAGVPSARVRPGCGLLAQEGRGGDVAHVTAGGPIVRRADRLPGRGAGGRHQRDFSCAGFSSSRPPCSAPSCFLPLTAPLRAGAACCFRRALLIWSWRHSAGRRTNPSPSQRGQGSSDAVGLPSSIVSKQYLPRPAHCGHSINTRANSPSGCPAFRRSAYKRRWISCFSCSASMARVILSVDRMIQNVGLGCTHVAAVRSTRAQFDEEGLVVGALGGGGRAPLFDEGVESL